MTAAGDLGRLRPATFESGTAGGAQCLRLRFVADLVCPWCYIGFTRLQRLLADAPCTLIWQPFLLNPHLPPAGVPRRHYLERKFGSFAQAQGVHRRASEIGAGEGLRFAFAAIRAQPNTVSAHALVLAAAASGRLVPAANALFRAFFVKGADLGDPAILSRIAADLGLPAEAATQDARWNAVLALHAEACGLGINGVPAFLFGEDHLAAGAQPGEALAALIDLERYRIAAHAPAQGRQGS